VAGLRAVGFFGSGLIFGSFLTVVIYRIPRGQSLVRPRSSCPNCGVPIGSLDNIPVVSYILLRGRCRNCGTRIPVRYPVTELITAGLFLGAALALDAIWRPLLVAPFLGVLEACAWIDAEHRIIPNRVVYPSLVVFAVAVGVFSLVGSGISVVTAGLGLLALGGGLLLVAIIAPHGMGMGDVKLAALIGLVLGSLGWRYVGVAIMAAILAGGTGAILALLAGGSRKDTIPFGPYLAGGGILSALFAPQIAGWYTSLLH
jgi:leader peptidase (prepilin peptidase)/N-methyltransferase